jgi:hypothetical protein
MKKVLTWMLFGALVFSANIGAKVRFGYRFENGKTTKYVSESETRINQEMAGQPMVSTIKSEIGVLFEPTGTAENGDILCNAWFDRLVVHFSSSYLDSTFDLAAFTRKRAKLVLTPSGKVKSVVPVDTMPAAGPMLQMMGIDAANFFRNVLIRLPQAELGGNETWVNSVPDTVQMSGMEVIVTPKVEYRISGREPVSGFDCVKVEYAGPAKTAGKGSRMGADITFEGEGKVEGSLAYAEQNGLIISGETRSEQQASIVMTGAQNMTMTQNTSAVVKMRYVP